MSGPVLLLLDVPGGVARLLLGVAVVLPTFRTALVISRLAFSLLLPCVLAASLLRIPRLLPLLTLLGCS
jgi:hypothetical protein